MALLRGIFWLGLFVLLTFCFVVLFEYGPGNFKDGAQKEYARIKSVLLKEKGKIGKPKNDG